jgi:hypothetical protein
MPLKMETWSRLCTGLRLHPSALHHADMAWSAVLLSCHQPLAKLPQATVACDSYTLSAPTDFPQKFTSSS